MLCLNVLFCKTNQQIFLFSFKRHILALLLRYCSLQVEDSIIKFCGFLGLKCSLMRVVVVRTSMIIRWDTSSLLTCSADLSSISDIFFLKTSISLSFSPNWPLSCRMSAFAASCCCWVCIDDGEEEDEDCWFDWWWSWCWSLVTPALPPSFGGDGEGVARGRIDLDDITDLVIRSFWEKVDELLHKIL